MLHLQTTSSGKWTQWLWSDSLAVPNTSEHPCCFLQTHFWPKQSSNQETRNIFVGGISEPLLSRFAFFCVYQRINRYENSILIVVVVSAQHFPDSWVLLVVCRSTLHSLCSLPSVILRTSIIAQQLVPWHAPWASFNHSGTERNVIYL